MQPAPDSQPLDEFGPYLVHERLGLGGMATVHRAKKRGIEGYERNVALKRMLSHLAEDAGFVESFIREAKVASLLVHPNIAQVYDFGRINGVYYIAMELVQGYDLRKLLRHANRNGEPIPLPVILTILAEMCDALDYAHTFVDEHGQALGIVHRDVSPSNLIVALNGHVKMIDFGIAKAQSRQLRTESGQAKGKLGYMAPEAAMGMQIDATSDVFSGGVVAWELITAQPLFQAKSDFETMRRIREMEVVPPSHHNPQCPPALDQLVLSATARDNRFRLGSARIFREKIEEIAEKLGVTLNARHVAEWIAPFAAQGTQSSNPYAGLPLQSAPEPTTQAVRRSGVALRRSREEMEHATEIWGEDAQTVHQAPSKNFSHEGPVPVLPSRPQLLPQPAIAVSQPNIYPTPVTQNPIVIVQQAKPRSVLPVVLIASIVAVGAGIAAVVVFKKNQQKPDAVAEAKKQASIKFQIDPPNAIVEIGGREVSRASPYEAMLDPGIYTVTVRADGYKKWTAPLTLHDDEHQPVTLQLEKLMGKLVVDSSPRGLEVIVDGKPAGSRTMATLDLAAGKHSVSVTSATGEVWKGDVDVPADGQQNLTATFGQGAATAKVETHHVHHQDVAKSPDPTPEPPKVEPTPEPPKPEPPKVDPTPPKLDPVPLPEPPKVPGRIPVVPATSVTKLSGEIPAVQVHGGDTNGDVSAKMCIDATGAVSSVKMLKAPAEIAGQLQTAFMGWKYKPTPSPVCFLLNVRVMVKRAD